MSTHNRWTQNCSAFRGMSLCAITGKLLKKTRNDCALQRTLLGFMVWGLGEVVPYMPEPQNLLALLRRMSKGHAIQNLLFKHELRPRVATGNTFVGSMNRDILNPSTGLLSIQNELHLNLDMK